MMKSRFSERRSVAIFKEADAALRDLGLHRGYPSNLGLTIRSPLSDQCVHYKHFAEAYLAGYIGRYAGLLCPGLDCSTDVFGAVVAPNMNSLLVY